MFRQMEIKTGKKMEHKPSDQMAPMIIQVRILSDSQESVAEWYRRQIVALIIMNSIRKG